MCFVEWVVARFYLSSKEKSQVEGLATIGEEFVCTRRWRGVAFELVASMITIIIINCIDNDDSDNNGTSRFDEDFVIVDTIDDREYEREWAENAWMMIVKCLSSKMGRIDDAKE